MTDDWTDAVVALLSAGARFMVVGAHAMAVHGVPRATQDLDVWIEATEDNASRVWSALVRFGAPLEELGITREFFMRPDTVIQLGLPPNRIDVLTAISGVDDFVGAWEERVEHVVVGPQDPVSRTRCAGREQARHGSTEGSCRYRSTRRSSLITQRRRDANVSVRFTNEFEFEFDFEFEL